MADWLRCKRLRGLRESASIDDRGEHRPLLQGGPWQTHVSKISIISNQIMRFFIR